MAKNISEEDVRQAVAELMHPAIDRTLVTWDDQRYSCQSDRVTLTLVLSFLGVPIKDYLVNSVQEAIMKLGVEIEIKTTEMNQEELQTFLAMERKS